jgi:hypothetical protein
VWILHFKNELDLFALHNADLKYMNKYTDLLLFIARDAQGKISERNKKEANE